jgi:hypothetical protein
MLSWTRETESSNLMKSGQHQIEPLPEWRQLCVVKVGAQIPYGVPCPPVESASHLDINNLGNYILDSHGNYN